MTFTDNITATSIYHQHDRAFAGVSAYVILDEDRQVVARVTMKHAAACTAYVHWFGVEMTKGRATGYGYDKSTAAVEAAAAKISADPKWNDAKRVTFDAFAHALKNTRENDGEHWDRRLRDAGFVVVQAV